MLRTKDFSWNLNANFSYNKNKITELYNGVDEYEIASANLKYVVGHSATEFYINRYAGVNPTNGDALWYTKDGEITTEFRDSDKVMTGKSFVAPWQGGFGTTLTWKGISLAAQFSWVADRWAVSYTHLDVYKRQALVSGEGEDVESMLTANPKLSVSGFYTKSIYDFQKKSYSSFTDEKDIIPTGEWEIVDERLVGKDLILIPQEATVGYQYITLEANGKPYTCLLPSTLKLQEGKQRELEITFVAAEDILMSKLNGEINDWEGTEVDHTGSETLHKYIDVSKLTFENSNICKVLNKGKQMAEICKEYLVTPDFSSQAIVVYPMKEDGTADL